MRHACWILIVIIGNDVTPQAADWVVLFRKDFYICFVQMHVECEMSKENIAVDKPVWFCSNLIFCMKWVEMGRE